MPPNLPRKKTVDEMNSRTGPILMMQTQYARHRNQSPQYISNLAKRGVLVMRGRFGRCSGQRRRP